MAQAWATLFGLTGQMLLFGDRMPDLGPERVALMEKILPVAEIGPFDLFTSEHTKSIFDLKINLLGRAYEVVGFFNYDMAHGQVMEGSFAALGLDPTRRYHAYDFWHQEYLGLVERGVFL